MVPLADWYSIAIAPPPPVGRPLFRSPPFASIVPAPPMLVAVIHTEPPAALRLFATVPLARIAPSVVSEGVVIRTMPPPLPPLPAPPPASLGWWMLPNVVPSGVLESPPTPMWLPPLASPGVVAPGYDTL